MRTLHHKRISAPLWPGGDGIGLYDGQDWHVHDCIVDLSDCELDEIDECAGVTWGCSVMFERCVIRGAGKLVLCGCGDSEHVQDEYGKRVQFYDCILEEGGRRFPEVQDGMEVEMENCLIRNWGNPNRFSVRNFGAWAHSGGRIYALNCVFWQDTFKRPFWQTVRDISNHVGNAVNEYGLQALLRPITYLPGVCRGLMAGVDGKVEAHGCYRNHKWIRIEGMEGEMEEHEALERMLVLEQMAKKLETELSR